VVLALIARFFYLFIVVFTVCIQNMKKARAIFIKKNYIYSLIDTYFVFLLKCNKYRDMNTRDVF
jgi:hypothetical protein